MSRLTALFALLAVCTTATAGERNVIVPTDEKPFKAQQGDIVRLTGRGIAGSQIDGTVVGPAKIHATNTIWELADGRVLIGSQITEFELRLTGKGKVAVTITVKPPQPDAKRIVTKYEFEVK